MEESSKDRVGEPRWKEDFPVTWEDDHYITRREFAKFLTLGSGLLVGVSSVVTVVGKWFWKSTQTGPRVRIASLADVAEGGSLQFRYPTDEDPCILLRGPAGQVRAFSQVCTHLSCAVVHHPDEGKLFCPCHHGWFEADSGVPAGGPPTRRLTRIRLEVRGENIYAVGREA